MEDLCRARYGREEWLRASMPSSEVPPPQHISVCTNQKLPEACHLGVLMEVSYVGTID